MTALGSDHCPGCGAPLPDDPNGAHHRYMTSSSGCWETFGQVLAREFSEPGWFAEHRLTVDTYGAQHPGEDDRRQRQSVALHLIALCQRLEHRLDAEALLRITERLATVRRDWPALTPPPAYPMTVVDLLPATSAEEHLALVRQWADATWKAWRGSHAQVRAWAMEALSDERRA